MAFFTVDGKRVDVFPSAGPDRPIVYLNTFGNEGEQVLQNLHGTGCPDFTLVAVGDLAWERDMVPWDAPAVTEAGAPYTGGADAYLDLLLDEIAPRAEGAVRGTPPWRGIAGYSLAGLFAVYAIYRTDAFSRVASMSGSLWFPGTMEYVRTRKPRRKPDCVYLSLGARENKTRNRSMRCVRQNTEEIAALYARQGIDTAFELNPGNHFTDAVSRSAAGIRWMLER